MLLLVVFSVFDWLLGCGCIEDLEIYGCFDKHCSCLFQDACIYRSCSGVYVSGSPIEFLYSYTHFVVLPDLYEATPVTQFTLKMATARLPSYLYMTQPWRWSDTWCSVMFLRVALSPTAFFIQHEHRPHPSNVTYTELVCPSALLGYLPDRKFCDRLFVLFENHKCFLLSVMFKVHRCFFFLSTVYIHSQNQWVIRWEKITS